MVITHHGGQCFKVVFGDMTLVFDPISKKGSIPAVRFGADIAFVSRKHPDMNGVEEVSSSSKEPFVIDGPGEYEYGGVVATGFMSSSEYGLSKGEVSAINTIYSVKLEGMTLVHLGALSVASLPQNAKEGIDEIDILFVPVGGEGVLTPADASKISALLEPKVIIPMHFSGVGEKGALSAFLKEAGAGGNEEKTEKYTVKKKDISEKDGIIVVISN